jgi:2-aminoadipate transaminase
MTTHREETPWDWRFAANVPEPAQRFAAHPRYNFVGGQNDPNLVPKEALARAAADVLRRHGHCLAMYNMGESPLGFSELRAFVADKLKRHRGVECGPDDVLVTSGSGQGIDLVNRLLLDAGDTVIMEEFSFQGAINKARARGAKIVAAPMDREGLQVEALQAILATLQRQGQTPKYIYSIPTIQNPTGSVLSVERRLGLIRLARQFNVPIFEDECYADLVWKSAAPPALYALAPDLVIHIGSFSKTLAPALRVGYLTASQDIVRRLVTLKTDGGTGALDQMVASAYFTDHFDDHVQRLTGVLSDKLKTMIDSLQQEFGTSVDLFIPQGGIFLWLKLPDHIDVRTIYTKALAAGVAFNPGPDWACDADRSKSYLRLCFAYPTQEDIRAGIAELARVCFESTGIPARSGNIVRA